ncbi:MAG: ATP-binding protein [Chloroflexota bacterium]
METVQTNWVVLTGAPSSGKSTILNLLERKGEFCIPEVARTHIEEQLKSGKLIEDVLANPLTLHQAIINRMALLESALDPHRLLFLDRAYLDGYAFWQADNLDSRKFPLNNKKTFRYRKVFLFDPLPITSDGIRVEDEAQNNKIDKLLENVYKQHGYAPVRVPVFTNVPDISVNKRLQFIIENK